MTNAVQLPAFDLEVFADAQSAATHEGASVAAAIDAALRETGFLVVTGHGIDRDVRDRYFVAMEEFFSLPLEAKNAITIGNSSCHRGYVGLAAESLDGALGTADDAIGQAAAGDLKETLDTGIDHAPDHPEVVAGTPLFGSNQWPDLPGFRDAVEAYRDAAIEASERTHRGLAVALGLDPEFFLSQPGDFMYHLRLLHYPPQESVAPEPGQLGCGAHTDYGTITLLADDGNGGLQVRQRSGEWVDVSIPEGALVMNLGDLMAIWTNDRWVSNPHRVVNPVGVDRYSSPLFVEPNFHLRIEALATCVPDGDVPRHEPVTVGSYLLGRFDGTHAYRNPFL